jgi:uncharacterized RDD family membrane protein YckC
LETAISNADTARVPTRYATFSRRFRAVVVDTAIVCAGVAAIAIASDAINQVPGSGRIAWILMFSLLFLYEPLFIWRRGATIGHAMNHLVVVADATGRAPGLGQAFARYLIKAVLGLPSFVTMALSRKHQAVHDLLTRTTVQLAPSAAADLSDFHVERTEEVATPPPSRWRRTVVAFGYLIMIFVVYAIVLTAIDRHGCVRNHICSENMQMVADGLTLVWFAASLASIVVAWKGRLPGARHQKASPINQPPNPD